MAEEGDHPSGQATLCGCYSAPYHSLVSVKELGMDGSFAEVSLLACTVCGQQWLRYFYEIESFTASGRWYLGAVPANQAAVLTAGNAKATLENLSWYFYGGSYFEGQSGRISGSIMLNP